MEVKRLPFADRARLLFDPLKWEWHFRIKRLESDWRHALRRDDFRLGVSIKISFSGLS
jgi:hypothetical protein